MNFREKKIILFCHPRSGSTTFVSEFYKSKNISQTVNGEFLHLPGKNELTFSHFVSHLKNPMHYNEFVSLPMLEQVKFKKKEFFNLLENKHEIILKLFFRIQPEIFSLSELEFLKIKYSLCFIKLIRVNLFSGFLSHVIAANTGKWYTQTKEPLDYDSIIVDRNLIAQKTYGFFSNFQNNLHSYIDPLIDHKYEHESLFNENKFSSEKMNHESEKMIVLRNNSWIYDFFKTSIQIFNISTDSTYNLLLK